MSAPWPFVAWGMYVIGPIEPVASNKHRFILIAIDYLTKWVEAMTFKSVTKKVVVYFVHSNLICRFRILKVIITDNGANLNSHLMKEVCKQFKIMHRNSTPYRPKANGAIEASNKNIKKILRKMVQGSRQWHEKLPFTLLGYRTTVRTSVGATPYLLVYDTEVVIPAEVEIPSLRIVAEAEIDDDECVKTRLEQLSLIDEKRLAVVCHDIKGKYVDMAINSDAVKRYYKVKPSRELDNVTLSRSIAGLALRTMILEIESARREEKHNKILEKLEHKYFEYRSKYRDIRRCFGEGGNLRALRDELKEKDDELMRAIDKCSILEGTLRGKEEELKISKGIEA
ncbi:uncharacterized protein [Nicotiana sylvestris]|uniref:uncharacterized protein n=1 Tax=Nicotiana sylvestris TaxID=4096 RepID=UPI00388C60A9